MADKWLAQLKFDPIMSLRKAGIPALEYYVRHDLLDQPVPPVQFLWELPEACKILKKQLSDGSWPWSGKEKHPAINHHLIETWRNFRFLVEQYSFTRQHPQAERAAEYIYSCQSGEGDFRGILANQYATYYTGAILSLLVRAGYGDDPRTERCYQWLLDMRQNDLGWSIPIITHKFDRETQYRLTSEMLEPVQPDRSKPFSHNATGMILRAFAVHDSYCVSVATLVAARLLKSRFFQPDAYTSYQDASYWVRFEFPFWWNDLVSALDSLARIGISAGDPDIRNALDWLVEHQEHTGLWKVSYARPEQAIREAAKSIAMQFWITLAICRILKYFLDPIQIPLENSG